MWAHNLPFVVVIKICVLVLTNLLKSGVLKSFLIKENIEKQK